MVERRQVRLVNDPACRGVLTGREQLRRDRRLLQVQFPDGLRWIPENQLEPAGEGRLTPLDMLEKGRLGRPVDLRRTLTHVKLSGRLADVIYSMEATNTDFHAYQFKPVVKILEAPTQGLLIADEVGLGKTIEAGLIWTELRSRFDMRRLLVICPAALREKWKRELSTKIGVRAEICDAKSVLVRLQDRDMREGDSAIIASLQGLRPPREWEDETTASATADLARFLRSMENEERVVDLLVIDEAHHMRNPETRNRELGQLCKRVAEYTVFLSATPIHNRNEDLQSLLSLLDPDTFSRSDVFGQILEANESLVKARDLVLRPSPDVNELRDLIRKARAHPLLWDNKQLERIETADLTNENLANRDKRSWLAHRLETVNLLSHVLTRTRKRDVKEWRVLREPVPEEIPLTPIERKYYDLVTEIVIDYAIEREANERFLLSQPQRQMTSSMAASLRAWQAKLVLLEEADEEDDGDDEKLRASLGPLVSEIVSRSRDLVSLEELVNNDSKYKRLRESLEAYLKAHPSEKLVVFTAFRATLEYLAERLEADGIRCIQLKGGQDESKDEIILRFRDSGGPSVLLSSEVGGEGVDLQFSRVVVNYDLPWNPMRMEQRIGRIDRLGQTADRVFVWNLYCENTIDSWIYKKLYEKLGLIHSALGDFEAILGEQMRRLTADLFSRKLSPAQQEQRIEQTAQALENLRLEEERLEESAVHLIAHGDYILNQVRAARELNRWITGDDIRVYVLDYLAVQYPGCRIRQKEQDPSTYFMDLSPQAKVDLEDYIKRHKLYASTRLTAVGSREAVCRFQSGAETQDRAGVEIITQFHPLVRMVSEKVANGDGQLTPAVSLILESSHTDLKIAKGTYLLAAALWSFRGLQDTEKLAFAGTHVAERRALESSIAERLIYAAIQQGRDWLEAVNQLDLKDLYEIANEHLYGRLDEEFSEYTRDVRARNEDRAALQLRALEQHLASQTEALRRVLEGLQARGRTSLVKATEGRIRALHSRVEQLKIKLEAKKELKADSHEIALAVVQLV